ncbi:MAG: hypothetical protein GC137_04145 [Alphaproteobacteria bacterium]|nr:hypothetical protein [Alphaproteobacteria bacterium]
MSKNNHADVEGTPFRLVPVFEQERAPTSYSILEVSSNTIHFSVFYPSLDDDRIIDVKEKCGLGKYPKGTKKLSPEGKDRALDAIAGFKRDYLDQMPDTRFTAIATGALREAEDARKFILEIRDRFGIYVDVISGEEEALYAARGVLNSIEGACGLVWDMGGRSSEFAIIEDGEILGCESLGLGAFSFAHKKDPEKFIQKKLGQLSDQYGRTFDTLYAVGGNPRQIMKTHKQYTKGTRDDIHGYTVVANEVSALAGRLVFAQTEHLSDVFHISKKRQDLVPPAARVFRSVIDHFGIQTVVASHQGVRHGLLYTMLEEEQRALTLPAGTARLVHLAHH